MSDGLNVARVINVQASLAPLAASAPGYGVECFATDEVDAQGVAVVDGAERVRTYSSMDEVLEDVGADTPVGIAAALAFGQSPTPRLIAIGSFLNAAQPGFLKGATLTALEQTLATWTAIDDGSFRLAIDGGALTNYTGLDFSLATNLNGVATVINTALAGAAICTWDGARFRIASATTGVDSAVSFAITATADVGADISEMLKFTEETATSSVAGFAVETAAECAAALADASGGWYVVKFVCNTMPSEDDLVAAAAYIQTTGSSLPRLMAITTQDTTVLDSEVDDDIASRIKDLDYDRSFVQFSSTNPWAAASSMARGLTVDFTAVDATLTLAYKTLPGVVGERLTESQATTLEAKRCNVYARYNNGKTILQFGVMSGDAYFDERHGLDAFVGTLQNALFNRFYQAKRKVPQTNAGLQQLRNVAATVCDQFLRNGFLATGQWNTDGFGTLENGQMIPGYYIYAPLMQSQAQAVREQRIAPTLQIALKLAGAFHRSNVIVDVNR